LKRFQNASTGSQKKRPGRPRSLDSNSWKRIKRLIRSDPFISYQEIRKRNHTNALRTTIFRILKESGYGHYRAQTRPRLKEEHAEKRLAWALAHRNWHIAAWAKVIWSDECCVEASDNHGASGSTTIVRCEKRSI
jgi:hypothetical protein